jgi:hypothetical protein
MVWLKAILFIGRVNMQMNSAFAVCSFEHFNCGSILAGWHAIEKMWGWAVVRQSRDGCPKERRNSHSASNPDNVINRVARNWSQMPVRAFHHNAVSDSK